MKIKLFFGCVGLLIAGYVMFVQAGSLNPSAAPGSTMKTLGEIYEAVMPPSPNDVLPLPEQAKVEGADMIHVRINGEIQGEIRGNCTVAGREDTIVVEDFSHAVVSPRDAASGLPTGKRQHSPITITKRIDKSTPQLFYSLVNNETLTTVELAFYRTNSVGTPELYYTIELQDASISGISHGSRDQEQISFCYRHIVWTWAEGHNSAEDDWETPVI